MAKQIACGDVMPGCTFVAKADTTDDLMHHVVSHVAAVHGITEITPEVQAKVAAAVREVQA
jgi:predicted small metal-binding protein